MIQRVFNENLYVLKLGKLNRELHRKIYPAERRLDFEQRKIGQGCNASFYAKLGETRLALLGEFLEGVDRICREVWETQRQSLTPEFLRTVMKHHIFSAIAAQAASIRGHLELMARRTHFTDLAAPLNHLARKRGQLESEWSERYEIEAIELEHRAAQLSIVTAPESYPVPAAQNITSSWRDLHDRFMLFAGEEQERTAVITKATVLQRMDQLLRASCSYREHQEVWEKGKPEQGLFCLLDTPPHGVWNYSDGVSENFLERVRLCVAEAGRALPDCAKGTDAEDFWLHRLYLDLLKNKSDQLFAASEEGGMIVSLCVASATFCSRLERQALDQSESGNRSGAERLRTAAKQAESSRFQNSANSAQGVVSASTNATVEALDRTTLTHSPDYRSVTLRGETHALTSQQAQMVQILHQAHESGNPDVSVAHILEQLEKRSSRWQDSFKSNLNAKAALIKSGRRKGTLRLNL